jgi:G3E family GTPase
VDRGRIGKIKAWLDERFHCYRLIEATQYTRALGTVDGCEHRLILLEASGVAEPMGIAETFMDNRIFPSPGRVRR